MNISDKILVITNVDISRPFHLHLCERGEVSVQMDRDNAVRRRWNEEWQPEIFILAFFHIFAAGAVLGSTEGLYMEADGARRTINLSPCRSIGPFCFRL